MKLEGIRTFVAIVEAGSITAAARRLGVAKSVVSHRLSELEDAVGARLMQRSSRRLSLTEQGQTFHRFCARMLGELDEAVSLLAEEGHELRGPLRVAAPMSFGLLHLGPALFPFLREHPGIRLDLDLNDRMVDLVGEGYDMAIRIGQLPDSTLVARRLVSTRNVLVASPEYARAHGLPAHVEDLSRHRGILYSNVHPNDQLRFRRDGGWVTGHFNVAMRVNNGDAMRDAAIAGLGIAVIPDFIVWQALEDGHLQVVRLDAELPESAVYAVFPQNRHLPAKVRALVDHLAASFGDPPYWKGDMK
ncbi:LysR family transcriptional regulator [Thioalkalivibrio denitrificans]|uniref:LysR family transcriptional regulator n=1 Tax=Thioalkalivibrio denitrificans TaxID=108003 RepID=A0A1V3NFK4_9GAMM|nr:LysR family transcriptional regulator [Thioalkalivibrio denitrificans]OOG23632.1 LysR family transcriptional regulator [Thioalkalivibrio denitrificans]